MYVCMYVCMYVHTYVGVCMLMYQCTHMYTCVYCCNCNSAEEFDDDVPPTFQTPSTTPIHFTSVTCTGLEFNIGQCQFSAETSSTCTNANAVGVRCTQTPGV